ncbi:MAG: hypothetical protein JXA50_08620 [Deltaproteobacteria bacterium]|nr:hypothetical protein [Deltaproteobacteria bacterium]
MTRPSHKEIHGKIRKARELVSDGYFAVIEPDSIAADALELGYLIEDLPNIPSEILIEVKAENYVGDQPPQRSYEKQIIDCELFAFRWASKRFGCEIYVKFTLKDNTMWLVSLHEHREKEDE